MKIKILSDLLGNLHTSQFRGAEYKSDINIQDFTFKI